MPFTDDFDAALGAADYVVDAIFGFSFSGEVREPFPKVIEALRDTKVPVLAVDAPSSWNIETGPPDSGPGKGFNPPALISLTAPKPLVKWFKGRHFLGGRWVEHANPTVPLACRMNHLTKVIQVPEQGYGREIWPGYPALRGY